MTFPFRRIVVFAVFLSFLSSAGWNGGVYAASELRPSVKENRDFPKSAEALAHFLMGSLYDNDGQAEKAFDEYGKALAIQQDNPEIQVKFGSSLLFAGKFSEAEEILKRTVEIDPGNTGAYLLLAFIYTKRNEFQEAKKCYENVLKHDPGSIRAMTLLADLLVRENKLEEAAGIYEHIVAADKTETFAYFNLGILYSKLGWFDRARIALNKAIELDVNYIDARLLLGFLFEMEGNNAEAIELYESVTAIDYENTDARIRRFLIYKKTGFLDKAMEENRRIMEIEPFSLEPYMESYGMYVAAEKYEEAEGILHEALEKGFLAGPVYAGLGFTASKHGNAEKALGYYEKALEVSPDNDVYRFYVVVGLDSLGKREEATMALEKAVSEGAKLPEIYNYLGYIYAEDGRDLDAAEDLIGRALAEDPENGAYLDSLGWVYYKRGEFEKALQTIKKAAEYLPSDPAVREHLGDIYYSMSEIKKAVEEWKRALKNGAEKEGIERKIEDAKKEIKQQKRKGRAGAK
ncbi:MAG: tetratricopeptide repeat protein [Candidatus Omnitrophota bacterium]